MTSLAIPDVESWVGRTQAIQQLQAYYLQPVEDHGYTGSQFERLGGGGDRPGVAHEFTAEDFAAVTLLSVDVPGSAALRILGPDRNRLSDLLYQIPTDLDLVDVDPATIHATWPAWQLFDTLRALNSLGRTKVTKLIARKRPRLIPLYDREVNQVLGLKKRAHWVPLAIALRADDRALHRALLSLRADAGIGLDISPLRVLDVVTWMTGKGYTGEHAG